MKTITSANAVFLLSVGLLYPVAQKIEGFAADSAWAFDAINNAEIVQGVDGQTSAGWIPHLTVMTITLQPDKAGYPIFDTWFSTEEMMREKLSADGELTLSSIGKKIQLGDGFLSGGVAAPDGKKVLSPVNYKITWSSIMVSLI